MSIARTTSLALGASMIGSVPGMALAKPEVWPWILAPSFIGLILVLHGSGFLQNYIIRWALKQYRGKCPSIAIISDLPWKDGAHPWAWDKMTPNEWLSRITDEARGKVTKVLVEQIKIKRPWVRFFLDRYNIILNPYGSAYPEVNIKELPIFNTILNYVLNGGLFVNVADIPFYWAYDPQRGILYDLVKFTYQYEPQKGLMSFGPFTETLFCSELKVPVIGIEPKLNGQSLKLKDKSVNIKELDSVAINRVALIDRRTEYKAAEPLKIGRVLSVVEELEINGHLYTPICYVNFGDGRFLVSLLFMGYDKQSEQVKEKVTSLLCKLMMKELKDR